MSTVLVIPDIQVPFAHHDAAKFLKAVKEKYKPDTVVQIGDLLDQHRFSRFNPSTKAKSGLEEVTDAKKYLKTTLYSLFPVVKVCLGNHDLRIIQRAEEAGIDQTFMKTYKEIIDAPKGWSFEDRFEIDGVVYEHGIGRSGSQGALNAAKANMQSTVIGHLHAHAGILWYGNRKNLIFGFNVGALIDDRKYAFEYGRFSAAKSILGCGLVIDGVPVFIPMMIGKNHNWTGKLP